MANDFVIQGTSGLRLTADPVQIDANRQAYRLISADQGADDIPVGAPFVMDATGTAVLPSATLATTPAANSEREIYIRVSNTNTSSTSITQDIVETGGPLYQSQLSTNFAGLKGSGLRVGLPYTNQYFDDGHVTDGTLETPGQYLILFTENGGATVPRNGEVKFGRPTGGLTGGLYALNTNEHAFGVVERVEGGQILWFTFYNVSFRVG